MLTDRLDFRAWLAKHDAHGLEMAHRVRREPREGPRSHCDGCGGPLGDTPSQLREHCIVCLAERFGGDLVEEQMVKLLLGGMVKAAMGTEEIAADLVVNVVQNAIREAEHEQGFSWGRMSRERQKVTS